MSRRKDQEGFTYPDPTQHQIGMTHGVRHCRMTPLSPLVQNPQPPEQQLPPVLLLYP